MKNSIASFEPFRNWNYKKIIVQPNSALRNQQYYVSELKKLQARNEKETGIEFVIGDKNNYQDFIALIDAMKLANQETYGVDAENPIIFLLFICVKSRMKKQPLTLSAVEL